jgi:signal transduction histidine kinase
MFCGRRAGELWFGDAHGVARLEPAADLPLPPPQVRIASVRIDGQPLPLAPLGAAPAGPLELRLRPRHVSVEFFAISHASGERLLFQHRFDRDEDWSLPTESGTLEFPRLSTGRHRLSIRALPARGEAAPPAVLELVVPAPVWQRAWFLTLALASTIAAVLATFRIRVARAVALERIRTRIATDLHDDVGADLSRILLLTEFARRDIDEEPTRAGAMLAEVSSTAREAVINMSDIVWALKRGNEPVAEVIARVRDYAAPGAASAGVAFDVEVDPELAGVVLAGELRRGLYLLLKEA